MTQPDKSDSAKGVRVSLRWDDITLSSQDVAVGHDQLNLDRWNRIDIRLDPRWIHQSLTIYESTLLIVTFEKLDAAGRRLTR